MKQQSEAQTRYQYTAQKATKIDQNAKNDLRKHHFHLGTENSNFQTMNNACYNYNAAAANDPKMMAEINETKSRIRKHNFAFGEDDTSKVSVMQADYLKKAKDMDIQAKRDLRTTNFTFGTDMGPQYSVNSATYAQQNGAPAKLNAEKAADLRNAHFNLGDDVNPWKTNNSVSYYKQNGSPERLNEEQKAALRASHFKLGQEMSTMQSVSHASHTGAPIRAQTSENKELMKNIRNSHFSLGDPNAGLQKQSEFATRFHSHGGHEPATVNQAAKNELRATHFQLGGEGKNYVSTNTSSYQARPSLLDAKQMQEIKDREAEIRKHSFVFGDDPHSRVSVMHAEYNSKPTGATRVSEAAQRELRATHWGMGNESVVYTTTMANSYQKNAPEPGAFNKEKANDLRKEHFAIGENNQWPKHTTNSIHHTWKQPY